MRCDKKVLSAQVPHHMAGIFVMKPQLAVEEKAGAGHDGQQCFYV